MKRLIQFVAVLLVALMAGVPALAAVTCSMSNSPQASACPMEMSSPAADCPMAQMDDSGCAQECCSHPLPAGVAPMTATVRPELKAALVAILLPVSLDPAAMVAVHVQSAIDPSPPPRYILNSVFRI
jgi:hypothetical protein